MSKIGYIGNINAFVDIQTEEILEKLRTYKADIYGIETTSEVKDVDELPCHYNWNGTQVLHKIASLCGQFFVCRMMASRAKSLFLSQVE